MGLFNFLKKDKDNDYKHHLLDYSAKIFADVWATAELLRKELELDQLQWFKVLFEYLNLVLNLTDRAAFNKMSNEKRNKLMSELVNVSIPSAVDAICNKWSADEIKQTKEDCLYNYKVSLWHWGKYEILYAENDKKMGETVFWEFSKYVANLIGHTDDIAFIMKALIAAMRVYKDLDASSFIEKINNSRP